MIQMNAQFVQTVEVKDPHFGTTITLNVYKEDSGLIFATEALFSHTQEALISPYGNGTIDLEPKDSNANEQE